MSLSHFHSLTVLIFLLPTAHRQCFENFSSALLIGRLTVDTDRYIQFGAVSYPTQLLSLMHADLAGNHLESTSYASNLYKNFIAKRLSLNSQTGNFRLVLGSFSRNKVCLPYIYATNVSVRTRAVPYTILMPDSTGVNSVLDPTTDVLNQLSARAPISL